MMTKIDELERILLHSVSQNYEKTSKTSAGVLEAP